MRILGVILILIGLLACLSIVGAILGVPMIIIGIVLVLLGGRRKIVITNVVNVANTPTGTIPAEQMSTSLNMMPREARAELTGPDNRAPAVVVPSSVQMSDTPSTPTAAYDTAKWKALVEFDSDIAAAVQQLEAYGQRYVDQLAAAYLALNDKQYLVTITQKVVARAQQGG
jgi:hypothetical protein